MMWLIRRQILHGAVVASLLLMLAGPVTGVTVHNDAGKMELGLGQQLRSYIIIHNPLDEEDTVSLTATPTMPSGKFSANIISESRYTDRAEIQVAANSNRSVPILYTASLCTTQPSCVGDVTFNARSLESDSSDSQTVPVEVNHQQEVYGSPGISAIQLIVLAVLGTVVVAIGQNGRRSRRSSDRPDT